MIKIGDKVICITNKCDSLNKFQEYTIIGAYIRFPNKTYSHIRVNNITLRGFDDNTHYDTNFFISSQEYRKLKIEKLCSE
jgi:hypothetical protein